MEARGGGTLVEAVLLPLFQLGVGQPRAALVLLRNVELRRIGCALAIRRRVAGGRLPKQPIRLLRIQLQVIYRQELASAVHRAGQSLVLIALLHRPRVILPISHPYLLNRFAALSPRFVCALGGLDDGALMRSFVVLLVILQ